MFDIQTSPHTGLLKYSSRGPMMTNGMPPSLIKTPGAAGIRNNGKMEVCGGQKKCSVSAADEVA